MTKKIISILLAAVLILALASCSSKKDTEPDQPATADETANKTAAATTAETQAPESVALNNIPLRFQTYAVADDVVYYGSKNGIFRSTDGGEWEKLSDHPTEQLSLNNDVLFFVSDKKLCSVKTDGSAYTELCESTGKASELLSVCENRVFYTEELKNLMVYDTEKKISNTVLNFQLNRIDACGNMLLYLKPQNSSDKDTGTLTGYNIGTDQTSEIYSDPINKEDILTDSDAVYFVPGMKNDAVKSKDVYSVDPKNGAVKKVNTVTVETSLGTMSIHDGILIYQELMPDTGNFKTYTAAVDGGKATLCEDVDFKLLSTKSDDPVFSLPYRLNVARLILYSNDASAFKMIDNVKDKPINSFCYTDDYCCYQTYESKRNGETPVIEKLQLSGDIPHNKDLDSLLSCSADNDYLRLKKTVTSEAGYLFKIPELTIDSEDAKKVNSELYPDDFEAKRIGSSVFGQYYRSEVNGNYLTFYTGTRYDGNNRGYELYCFDVSTGKQLTAKDAIALVTDDADAFYAALKEELRRQQDFVYTRYSTQLELEREGLEAPDNPEEEVPEKVLERFFSDKAIQNIKLGYLGSGRFLCLAEIAHNAGGGSGPHLFIFRYPG